MPTPPKPKKKEQEEDALDEALEESFPASDPPAVTREPAPEEDGDEKP